jgi:hypothetical protein
MREFVVTIIGLLAASLATGLVVGIVSVAGGNPVAQLPVVMFLASSFSLVPAFVFGGILFVALRSFNLVRWWSAALGGVAVGGLVGALFRSGAGALSFLAMCVLAGAVSGFVFWAAWRVGMRYEPLGVKDGSSSDVPAA